VNLRTLTLLSLLLGSLYAVQPLGEKVQEELLKREAAQALEAKEFAKALEILEELSLQRSDDPWVNYRLGVCAAALKLYDEAIAAYERVLIVNPEHIPARLELAQVYLILNMNKAAKKEFAQLLKKPALKPETAAQVQAILATLEARETRHQINGALMVGLGYDDNVNNAIGSGNYKVVPENVLGIPDGIAGDEPESDTVHTEMATLQHRYNLSGDGRIMTQASATLLTYTYQEQTDLNLLYASLQAGVTVEGRHTYRVSARMDSLSLGGEDYMQISGLDLGYRINMAGFMQGFALVKYAQKTYATFTENDATYTELSLGLRHGREWETALIYGAESGAEAANINRNTLGLRAGYLYPVSSNFSLTLLAAYMRFDYQDETYDQTLTLSKRADTQMRVGAGCEYLFDQNLRLQLTASHITNDSNHQPYQYEKNLAGLNLTWLF